MSSAPGPWTEPSSPPLFCAVIVVDLASEIAVLHSTGDDIKDSHAHEIESVLGFHTISRNVICNRHIILGVATVTIRIKMGKLQLTTHCLAEIFEKANAVAKNIG